MQIPLTIILGLPRICAPCGANAGIAYVVVNNRTGLSALITSNTSNTLTVLYQNYSTTPFINTGDAYSIYKVLVMLDQPGRGKGNLVTGDVPTPAWPNDALEPVYAWNNTVQNPNDSTSHLMGCLAPLEQGRDVINNTPMPGYTPYTYPHPLVSGTPPPPAAPTNLRIAGP